MIKNQVFLGLGTNLGNLDRNLKCAIREIEKRVGIVISQSAFYKTAPWGFDSKNIFLNAVVCIETTFNAFEVLNLTQGIERDLGRLTKSNGSYSDRIIDIDILFFNQEIISTEKLTIPHPLICKRDFVLIPLKEIAPDYIHPSFLKPLIDINTSEH